MIVGVDFGAPQRTRDQRRKIIAVVAHSTGWNSYRIDATGMNARLLAGEPPGWSAKELVDELVARPARVVGFDFPFCVPHALLRDPKFASDIGYEHGAFLGWRSFNSWIAQRLPLTDPLDFTPFAPWRDRAERSRLWTKRATDIAAGGQPPLKDKFQATFQMTLLGNALLAKVWESHQYRVLPVASNTHVWRGFLQAKPADALREVPPEAWVCMSAGAGTKGPRLCEWARLRLNRHLGLSRWLR
ncbi:hypothetical protein KRR26_35715 [Corallococcus sp. M34]|uniref:hypothetical protein n=1 Tax=Citreicoccus inhibens TaxID=2849499 RepID=UPI001C2283A3|nr:hypothetical protein [Citreicoccus inhibens]MBU8900956.1 hypothetical protein [Citreicoccus inhibens]